MFFFVLSKLFWTLAAPLNLCTILLCAGGAVFLFSGRAGLRCVGKFLTGAGLVLLLGLGVLPLGHDALVLLETRYPPLDVKTAGKVDGIILLGGAVETRIPAVNGLPEINDNADRIAEFIRLARLYPQARLVFTGGSAEITGGGPPEADLIAPLLKTLGLGGREVIYERFSRNTYENAVFTKALVKPGAGERWVLVTSAYHMPRSFAVFESAGWRVVPAPSDFRTDGKIIILPRRFDVSRAMEESGIAIKELIGLVAYAVTGKISSLPPER